MTAATTKDRPAATGRPLTPESRSNGSQTDEAPAKGHNMNTDKPNAPAWATDAGPWEAELGTTPDEPAFRIVCRTEPVAGHFVSLAGTQQPDGRITEYSLDLGDLDGRPLANPAADIIEAALALLDIASKYVADDHEAYMAATHTALNRRQDG